MSDAFPSESLLNYPGFAESYLRGLQADTDRKAAELIIARNMAIGSDIAAAREMAKRREDLAGDTENRILHYSGGVDHKMLLVVRATMNEWARLDAMDGLDDRPYEFHLTSPGGDIISGLAVYDYLRKVDREHPLTTVAVGMCASMATVLIQAGRRRLTYPSTSWLIHQAAWGAVGKQGEIEDAQAHVNLVEGRIFEILASRSNHSVKQIKAKSSRKDWWFLGEQAAEFGLVDGLFE